MAKTKKYWSVESRSLDRRDKQQSSFGLRSEETSLEGSRAVRRQYRVSEIDGRAETSVQAERWVSIFGSCLWFSKYQKNTTDLALCCAVSNSCFVFSFFLLLFFFFFFFFFFCELPTQLGVRSNNGSSLDEQIRGHPTRPVGFSYSYPFPTIDNLHYERLINDHIDQYVRRFQNGRGSTELQIHAHTQLRSKTVSGIVN